MKSLRSVFIRCAFESDSKGVCVDTVGLYDQLCTSGHCSVSHSSLPFFQLSLAAWSL